MGFEIAQIDLLDEFEFRLQSEQYDIEAKQKNRQVLSEEEEKYLARLKERLVTMRKPSGLKYTKARLSCVCDLVQRRPNNVVPLTDAENNVICKLSYQAWDWLVNKIQCGTVDDLKGFVVDPDSFVNNRSQTAVIAQDATPVYLDISTGKVMIRASALDAARRRLLEKRLAKVDLGDTVVNLAHVEKPNDARGATRREKNRLSMILRQGLTGYFDETKEMPEGHILDSVLIVHAARHARLELMSFAEPSYWLRDISFEIDGKPTKRSAGSPVGLLLKEWREVRRARPDLFYRRHTGPEDEWVPGKVRVWSQSKATEDTIIASWLSDLIVEDGFTQCLKSVDCVASEHTPHMVTKQYLNQQIPHTIGMRQTAKTQVTDVRFAKMAKNGAEDIKAQRRRVHRVRNKERGEADNLMSKHTDLIMIAQGMHKACVDDNKANSGVLKAFRMAGWLAFRPTSTGLKAYQGQSWGKFPLGSSRLASELVLARLTWLDSQNVPVKPDWEELRTIQRRQTLKQCQKQSGHVRVETQEAKLAENAPLSGFMDILDGRGEMPFEDRQQHQDDDVCIEWLTQEDISADAAYLSLHPRIKRALLMQSEVRALAGQTGAGKQHFAAEKRQRRKMQRQTQKRNQKENWQALVNEVGIAEARLRCVPNIIGKEQRKALQKQNAQKKSAKAKIAKAKKKKVSAGKTLRRNKAKIKAKTDVKAHIKQALAGMARKVQHLQAQIADNEAEKTAVVAHIEAADPPLAADAAGPGKQLANYADHLAVRTLALQSVAKKIFQTQQETEAMHTNNVRKLNFRPYSKAHRQVIIKKSQNYKHQ